MSENIKLPAGWAETTLANIVAPRSDRISPSSMPNARYIGLEHVEAGTNKILGTVPASEMASSCARFQSGDVLYGRMRPYLNKVVRPRFDGLASAEFIVLPENEAVNGDFLLNRISSADFVEFSCGQYAGDRPRVKFEQLAKFPIKLPPVAEQARIVLKMEELFSGLDAGEAELNAAKIKLGHYRHALLKSALEGELTAEWRAERTKLNKTDETGAQLLDRVLAARRSSWEAKQLKKFREQGKEPPKGWESKYPHPVEPHTEGLPPLTNGWVWASLDMLGEIASGVAKGMKRATDVEVKEISYLRVANVQRGYFDLSEVKTILASERDIDELKLQKGDVLFNEGGDRDKLGRGWVWNDEVPNCIHQNHVFRMRPFLSEIVPELVSHHGNTFGKVWFQNAGKQTTNLASINLTMLRMFPVPLPPAAEQKEILARLKLYLETVDRENQAVDTTLKQLSAQRENIRKAAFSGLLVAQDSNDESASKALERLQVSKVARQSKRHRQDNEKGNQNMQSVSTISLRQWIANRDEQSFTFEDIRKAFPHEYDALKDALFKLLGEEKPLIRQVFEVKGQNIQFRRVGL